MDAAATLAIQQLDKMSQIEGRQIWLFLGILGIGVLAAIGYSVFCWLRGR